MTSSRPPAHVPGHGSGPTAGPAPTVAAGRRALVAPLAVATAGVVGVGVLRVVDVTTTPILPPCPFLALTGLWCPFCGGTRALDAIVAGDVVTAAGMNALVVLLVPLVLLEWTRWTVGRARGRPTSFMNYPSRVVAVAAAVAVLYAVVRNLPGMEALTPALGVG